MASIAPARIGDHHGSFQAGWQGKLYRRLSAPVDGTSVAVIRIGLGLLVAIEAFHYLTSDWIAVSFLDPELHFTFQGFDWLQPWPGIGMYLHFAVLGALALCVAAGIAHRIVAPLVALGFAYVFLLDKAEYLNHFYAAILLLVLIAAAPADRALSVASWRHPGRPRTVPVWAVWVLRLQVGVIAPQCGQRQQPPVRHPPHSRRPQGQIRDHRRFPAIERLDEYLAVIVLFP